MKNIDARQSTSTFSDGAEKSGVLTLNVRQDLCKAFQRCKWILVNETGRDQHEIMNEMVYDFLVKHGC